MAMSLRVVALWIAGAAAAATALQAKPGIPASAAGLPPSLDLVSPADNAPGIAVSPTLDIIVGDPDTDSVMVSFYGRPLQPATTTPFSLIIVPDTQYYTARLNGGLPAMMNAQMYWIVAMLDQRNIAWVDQVGDCTNNGDLYEIEWSRAVTATNIIENPVTTLLPHGVPYSISVGNHDQSPAGEASGTTNYYNQYYGVSHFSARPYYGGHYGSNNDNHFSFFSVNGVDFIVISLEYDTTPDPEVLDWADDLLAMHPERLGIVSSHHLVNLGLQASWSLQGLATYNALKDNPNLFLMVCGHVPGEGRRVDTFMGRTVHTVMADYQERANGGDGFLRIMTLYPGENVARVKTYSPWLNQYEADADSSSQFTLPVITTNWKLIATQKVRSGAHAAIAWPGRAPFSGYQWYASLDDGGTRTNGPVWTFVTGATPANVELSRPNGGEALLIGGLANIEWNAGSNATSVDVLLSRTGPNGSYTLIASGEPNDGSYRWWVSGPASNNAVVKVVAHAAGGNTAFDQSNAPFAIVMPTGAGDVPAVFGLDMRSANPAGGASLFDVSLEHDAFVTITVYDVTGRRVAELMNDMMPAGHHDVRWSGQSERGVTNSGVYFVRMDAAGRTFTHRVVVIR